MTDSPNSSFEHWLPTRILAVPGGASWHSHPTIGPQVLGDFAGCGVAIAAAFVGEAIGLLIIGVTLYGDILGRPLIDLLALVLAGFLCALDVWTLYRFPLIRLGLAELRRCGLRYAAQRSRAAVIALTARFAGMIATAGVAALFATMGVYDTDIRFQNLKHFRQDNAPGIERAAATQDAAIRRTTAELEATANQLRDVDRQITPLQQEELRLAARARRKPGAVLPSPNPMLASLGVRRAEVLQRHDRLKVEVTAMTENRNAAIIKDVTTDANHVPMQEGVLAKLRAFGEIVSERWSILLIIAAVESVMMGVMVAPALAHAMFRPSTYAAQLALEQLKELTSLARQAGELPAPAAPDPQSPDTPAQPPQPPPPPSDPLAPTKRKRGRPPGPRPNGHDPQPQLQTQTPLI